MEVLLISDLPGAPNATLGISCTADKAIAVRGHRYRRKHLTATKSEGVDPVWALLPCLKEVRPCPFVVLTHANPFFLRRKRDRS